MHPSKVCIRTCIYRCKELCVDTLALSLSLSLALALALALAPVYKSKLKWDNTLTKKEEKRNHLT